MSMTLFDSPSFANHEGVHAVFDEKTGLRAIIAVHSSARGPAVGGTRMWNYASSAEALEDVLRHGAWHNEGAPTALRWSELPQDNSWPLGQAPMLG